MSRRAYHDGQGRVDFDHDLEHGEIVVLTRRGPGRDWINETCRVELAASGSYILRPTEEEAMDTKRHPDPIGDALASAGLSRNSELDQERIDRARQLADGAVSYSSESQRRAFIMGGSPSYSTPDPTSIPEPDLVESEQSEANPSKEEATMEASEQNQENQDNGRKGRGPDPKSNRQRILKSALKAILAAEATEDHGEHQLSRAEVDKAVKVKSTTKATPADWVADAVRNDVVIDGHKFTKPARATFGVEEVPVA